MGAKQARIDATKTSFSEAKSKGFSVIDYSFKDSPQFLKYQGDLQCAITQVLAMNTPNGKL